MRATGFGIKAPADASGEFLIPMRKKDGTNMDYNYKSITEQRREALYEEKMKKMSKTQNIKEVIGKKFSGFSKADRFAYRKVSYLCLIYFLISKKKSNSRTSLALVLTTRTLFLTSRHL